MFCVWLAPAVYIVVFLQTAEYFLGFFLRKGGGSKHLNKHPVLSCQRIAMVSRISMWFPLTSLVLRAHPAVFCLLYMQKERRENKRRKQKAEDWEKKAEGLSE